MPENVLTNGRIQFDGTKEEEDLELLPQRDRHMSVVCVISVRRVR